MLAHYSYRLDHDLGFSPHIWRNVATVCGCKDTTIEQWAKVGSWVVGIGGNGTHQPDKLIYAMEVTETPLYNEFRAQHPQNASYLCKHPINENAPVLVSRGKFYYFGKNALTLPTHLSHIIHRVQGCKRLSEDDISSLKTFLAKFEPGKHGEPNNTSETTECYPPVC